MSSCILLEKQEYLVVINGGKKKSYYTIINKKLNTHVHINDSIKTCKIIVQKAIKNDFSKSNSYIKHKVEILLGQNEEWNENHNIKIYNHNLY
jgi:hypothetical protein